MLGDGRAIGALTQREYDLERLDARDQRRVERGSLAVIQDAVPETTAGQSSKTPDATSGKQNGGKK